ncbi:TIGR01459 family HAD-type hydrolase [Mucilaginibacter sp. RS28]|uniref:TIGR01459 family HAD-type hydrolase n=1 Tax=Mucilaginibacter straminoryzae TaxID=2932774 RepID=A0A9X2B9D6_9SPHI|nr:TIGR01459 family HAD-type hydrolase [Mucilaginibacter straminoryzae]MCJ8209640.1 TIGR01459 family HAD-type hydrolase [Mucilaginibacter straminoryzae]
MIQTVDFKAVIDKYQTIFFDSYGVIKNHNGKVPGVDATFEYLEQTGKQFYVLTNDASRSPIQLAQSFQKIGLSQITADKIISSGMLAKDYLDLKVNDGTVAYLGTPDSAHYIDSSGLHTMPVSMITEENIDQVNALVFLDDEGFDWFEDLNKAVNLIRRRNIPAIVANTDHAYPVNKQDVAIAIGGLAHMIEHITGKKFIRFGKPDSQMFNFAYDILRAKGDINKKDILMVGDTLNTDIIGGNKFGLDTVLVLTGNTLPKDAETRITATGIVPTYICTSAVID